jgi:proteasome beta subunit
MNGFESHQNNLALPMPQTMSPTQRLEMLKTGTTTIGITLKDGVILATESQATAGFFVASKTAQKLFKINNFTGATIAGGVADCQYVIGQAQALSRLITIQHDDKLPTAEYMANIVRNILFNGRTYFYAYLIVGGYSKEEKRGRIYPIDLLGFMTNNEDFVSVGSGSTYALGVLEGNWKPNMSVDAGVKLVKQALTASRNRDAGSGYGLQICSITKDGFKPIEGPLVKE